MRSRMSYSALRGVVVTDVKAAAVVGDRWHPCWHWGVEQLNGTRRKESHPE